MRLSPDEWAAHEAREAEAKELAQRLQDEIEGLRAEAGAQQQLAERSGADAC